VSGIDVFMIFECGHILMFENFVCIISIVSTKNLGNSLPGQGCWH